MYKMPCSSCNQTGHNKKTCPNKKSYDIPKTELMIQPPTQLITTDMEKTYLFHDFLDKKFQDAIKENDKEVLASVEKKDKDLMKRIENFLREKMTADERLMNTPESILESIKTNTIIRAHFRKDTTRQSLHQKAQLEWIQMHQYDDAAMMSADDNGTCLSKNNIHVISKKTNPRPSDATKTFDIYIPSKKLFAVLKHTSVSGGAQDNQFADVKHFISQEVGYLTKNIDAEETFVAYLDGAYYTSKKIKELDEMIPTALKERILLTNCASIKPKNI